MNSTPDSETTFPKEIEDRMIEHMNEDHVDAMRDYCKLFGVSIGEEQPKMVSITPVGFDLLVNEERVYFAFDKKCTTPQAVREALVALAEKARSS